MKKLLLTIITIATLVGCQMNNAELKGSIRECLVVGHEIEKMERAKGHDQTADKVAVIVSTVQKVVDANDIDGNCPMLEATATVAYEWVSEEYPETLYPTLLALLRERLSRYCDGEVVN